VAGDAVQPGGDQEGLAVQGAGTQRIGGASTTVRALHLAHAFAIVPFPAARQLNKNKRRGRKNEGVDEGHEISHNLTSLLLTNKTIRTMQQGSLNCLFFKN
jgi:hypothetical protein